MQFLDDANARRKGYEEFDYVDGSDSKSEADGSHMDNDLEATDVDVKRKLKVAKLKSDDHMEINSSGRTNTLDDDAGDLTDRGVRRERTA